MKERQSVYIRTPDDFFPSFIIKGEKHAKLSFAPLHDGKYRVNVWGNDDFGMERDFDNSADATTMFRKIRDMGSVTKLWLEENGFTVF